MRTFIRVQALLCLYLSCFLATVPAQNRPVAQVVDSLTREPLAGATVLLKASRQVVTTDVSGRFSLSVPAIADSILIQMIGYQPLTVPFHPGIATYYLSPVAGLSSVTVQTGYQSIPKERATGSFAQVDTKLFNRRVSTNVLDRLDGTVPGMLFNKNNGEEAYNIRGRSTLDAGSSKPLIVLDNFPFEGDIAQLNPNDIASVTILKDAAAASIWGSRSANGVIVITTKKGRFNQPLQLEYTQNLTVSERPDLYYNHNYLSSADYISAERFLFDKGYYASSLNNTTSRTAVTPVVELLNLFKLGQLSQAALDQELALLGTLDLRDQYSRYLYQREVQQQYALRLTGGSTGHHYVFSVGYDQNQERNRYNGRNRLTLQTQQVFRLHPKVDLTTSVYYLSGEQHSPNGYAYRSVNGYYNTSSQLYPYAELADASGKALPTIRDYRKGYIDSVEALGFLHWRFRMLDEVRQTQSDQSTRDLIARAGLLYRAFPGFTAELQYQQEYQTVFTTDLKTADSYAARNLINRFASRNATTGVFTYALPVGGILDQSQSVLNSQNLRGQAQYQREGSVHAFSTLAGFEIRQRKLTGYSRTVYGYDPEYGIGISNLNYSASLPVNPTGTALLPVPPNSVNETLNRYVSYYANGSYTYLRRYTVSASARTDGANLFGVRTNERITPLWSVGGAWDVSKEAFYHVSWLPRLKLRATYGFNGNAVNANSLLTARLSTSLFTGLPIALLASAPNPELRWEKVRTVNLGIDFAGVSGRLSGSIEYYRKRGLDLLQDATLPPSTGFTTFSGNGASTLTQGFDVSIDYSAIRRQRFQWQVHVLASTLHDQVVDFEKAYLPTDLVRTTGNLVARPGKPLFSIWSYRWAGLDPANGDPQGYLNGVVSKNYSGIIAVASPDSLVYHGSARPTFWGALRQDFSFGRLALSLNITWKAGYYFRRNSVSLNYPDLVLARQHSDYALRWQQPGDELRTSVPSIVYPTNNPRNDFYTYSSVLVERADHVRLQDIRLSYQLGPWGKQRPLSLEVYSYVNNLGILWRANHQGIDPDKLDNNVALENIPAMRTVSFGVRLNLQ